MVYGERTDILKTMMAVTKDPERSWRKDALNEVVDKHTIDTCYTVDAGWETGIQPPNKPWIIVESYPSKEVAIKGHTKWVEYTKKGGRDFPDNQP